MRNKCEESYHNRSFLKHYKVKFKYLSILSVILTFANFNSLTKNKFKKE